MSGSDLPDFEYAVWADCWQTVRVFEAMSTQWRMVAGGATGLDYAVLTDVMALLCIPRELRQGIFTDLRVMEAEALRVMNEQH
jgi:hypothetical protein